MYICIFWIISISKLETKLYTSTDARYNGLSRVCLYEEIDPS